MPYMQGRQSEFKRKDWSTAMGQIFTLLPVDIM
jgi:hypothetical protein